MYYDEVIRSSSDLDLRSTFRFDLYGSYDAYFEAVRREKHGGAKINPLASLASKVIHEKTKQNKGAVNSDLFNSDLTWKGQVKVMT